MQLADIRIYTYGRVQMRVNESTLRVTLQGGQEADLFVPPPDAHRPTAEQRNLRATLDYVMLDDRIFVQVSPDPSQRGRTDRRLLYVHQLQIDFSGLTADSDAGRLWSFENEPGAYADAPSPEDEEAPA